MIKVLSACFTGQLSQPNWEPPRQGQGGPPHWSLSTQPGASTRTAELTMTYSRSVTYNFLGGSGTLGWSQVPGRSKDRDPRISDVTTREGPQEMA